MSDPVTIGVEEEFHVADAASRVLSQDGDVVLRAVDTDVRFSSEQFASEIYRSMVETGTVICETLDDVDRQLRALRRELCETARDQGRRVLAAGTMPLVHRRAQQFTPDARYRRIERVHQQVSREMMACGMHVHVGVDDREEAVQVLNHLRPYLANLLALSANSPFWDAEDTGYASYRTVLWGRWPSATVTELFADAAEYDRVCEALIASGAIIDHGQIYWDARLSVDHPTVEFRVADVCPTVEEAVLQAGLCRALVTTCLTRIRGGQRPAPVRTELLRAAKWRAARYGLEDQLYDPLRDEVAPAADVLARMVDELGDALDDAGDRERVTDLLDATLARGTGAARQRAMFAAAGRLEDTVDGLAAATCG